jgi:hypothetical protein
LIEVAYKTRAYCANCEAAIWTDAGGGNIICPCGGAEIDSEAVVAGDPVTDEAAFKAQAAADLQVSVDDIEVVAL